MNHHKSTKRPNQRSSATLKMSKTIWQWKAGSYLVQKTFLEYVEKKIHVHHMQKYSKKPLPVNMYQISNKPKINKFRFTATQQRNRKGTHNKDSLLYSHIYMLLIMVVVEIDDSGKCVTFAITCFYVIH